MKLQYRILWFDDNADFFNSLDHEFISERVSEWGFIPHMQLVTTPEAFANEAPYSDYDLLVVDYDLEEHGHGQDFIRQVRDQEVFTEIIFYSSGATSLLWEAVKNRQLQGIYIANRASVQEHVLKVGHQSLRKVLDLDNMRGIVMAEVGDLDLLIGSIIQSAISELEEGVQQELFARFYEKSSEHHLSLKAGLDGFMAAPTIELLLSLCDSNKRWQNFRRVGKLHKRLEDRKLGDYVADVLNPRNFLAHGVPTRNDNGSVTFRYNAKEYEFDEAVGVALRMKIIEYKNTLLAIEKEFMGQ